MARNEEKAKSMLHRYLKLKKDQQSKHGDSGKKQKTIEKRPYLAVLCDDLDDAKRWLEEINHEIARAVNTLHVQTTLTEDAIRELNDKANKLIRERRHWERQITRLGGKRIGMVKPRDGSNLYSAEDGEMYSSMDSSGYIYFGAAKSLPGIQERLSEAATARSQQEKRKKEARESAAIAANLSKRVDAEYFGIGLSYPDQAYHQASDDEIDFAMPSESQVALQLRKLDAAERIKQFVSS